MVDLEPSITPLIRLDRLSATLEIDLWIKRDDLSQVPGGGSKYRKLRSILASRSFPVDTLVTNGGTQSNHTRVAALLAARFGLECELVLHGDPEELQHPTGNLLLMQLAGARIHLVPPHKISDTIREIVSKSVSDGKRPMVIEGGGHSVHGALGLVEAVQELASQCARLNHWIPDFIIHASGTGGTQAGILAGLDVINWPTHVIGVSVARGRDRGAAVVQELYDAVRVNLGLDGSGRIVDFRDQWIGEGYARPAPRVRETIEHVCRLEGIPLDPTYTGKAMQGLLDMVADGTIPRGSRVLFWHTGGLLNLMASAHEWRPEL